MHRCAKGERRRGGRGGRGGGGGERGGDLILNPFAFALV